MFSDKHIPTDPAPAELELAYEDGLPVLRASEQRAAPPVGLVRATMEALREERGAPRV